MEYSMIYNVKITKNFFYTLRICFRITKNQTTK